MGKILTKSTRMAVPRKNPPEADNVMTDAATAKQIVEYFKPSGRMLDPCAGQGAFFDAMCDYAGKQAWVDWCESDTSCRNHGRDFFEYQERVDWIITNPPYSILRPWLQHSYRIADNVVYLVQMPRPFFTALLDDAKAAKFGIKTVYRVKAPDVWKAQFSVFGGGYAAVHWKRGYRGGIKIVDGRK